LGPPASAQLRGLPGLRHLRQRRWPVAMLQALDREVGQLSKALDLPALMPVSG